MTLALSSHLILLALCHLLFDIKFWEAEVQRRAMPQPPEGMLKSRISSQACFDVVSSIKVTFSHTPQQDIKIWNGKSQLGGKVSYYSDKYKLCASTHTSHIPPMFQSKTVLSAQLKHRSYVSHYPQTRVLPVGFRGTAVLAGIFGSGHRI